jgi:uncharacterized coiled-coil protein SlyX
MTITEIEDKVASGEMTAAQCFAQMRQHARSDLGKSAIRACVDVFKDYDQSEIEELSPAIQETWMIGEKEHEPYYKDIRGTFPARGASNPPKH